MKKKRILFLLIVLMVAAAAFYAYREYNRSPVNTAFATPDASLEGAALTAVFEQDELGATTQYVNKLIRVQDALIELTASEPSSPDEPVSYTLVLGTAGAATTIRCSMDSGFSLLKTPVTKGSKIVIQGICSGYNKDELLGSDIVMVRCALLNN